MGCFLFLGNSRSRLSDRVQKESSHELLANYPVVIKVPVQWGDQDAFGHVNNTVPHRWFESVRIELFGRIGLLESLKERRIGPILAAVSCNYRRQINFPDTVHVGIRVARRWPHQHRFRARDRLRGAASPRRRRNVDNRRIRLPGRQASPGARIRSPRHRIPRSPYIRNDKPMPRIPIDDLDDPRIAIYRSLKTTNLTRGLDQFVVEGEKLVARLLESRFPLVSILVTDRHLPAAGIRSARRGFGLCPPSRANRSTGRLPVSPRRAGLRRAAAAAADRGNHRLSPRRRFSWSICPKLSDPENLGAIARIGDVFGVDAIMTGPECPDPFSRRVLRVSMGSILRVPIIVPDRLADLVDPLVNQLRLAFIRRRSRSGGRPV